MIKQLHSRRVYKNQWLTVLEDNVEFENGHKGIYSVVQNRDFAMVAPYEAHKFTLVKVYRYPTKRYGWEFPSGGIENESPTEAAIRELREETGITAKSIKQIGFIHIANGFSTQGAYLFLATDLRRGTQQLESTESGLEVSSFSANELEMMIRNGEITDAPTINIYGLLKIKHFI